MMSRAAAADWPTVSSPFDVIGASYHSEWIRHTLNKASGHVHVLKKKEKKENVSTLSIMYGLKMRFLLLLIQAWFNIKPLSQVCDFL